jgi:hypothetical protein
MISTGYSLKFKKMKKLLFILFIFIFIQESARLCAQTYDGYTLYGKMGASQVYLPDINKNIYHTWSCSPMTGYSTYLLANHHILRSVQYGSNILNGPAMCGEVQDIDRNGSGVSRLSDKDMGIVSAEKSSGIGICPDPVPDHFCLTNLKSNARVRLVDLTGHECFNQSIGGNTEKVETGNLTPGFYFILITEGAETV